MPKVEGSSKELQENITVGGVKKTPILLGVPGDGKSIASLAVQGDVKGYEVAALVQQHGVTSDMVVTQKRFNEMLDAVRNRGMGSCAVGRAVKHQKEVAKAKALLEKKTKGGK